MYDPKVSVIWEIIRDFFESQGVPIDVSFYSTYELQVTALCRAARFDIAWNSPLAWLDAAATIRRRLSRHRHARHGPRPGLVFRGAEGRPRPHARRSARRAHWRSARATRLRRR